MTTTHHTRPGRRHRGPSPETVVLLQSVRSYPSVSLLATTSPAERMSSDDARTLDRLVAEAAERLRADPVPGAAAVQDALDETVARAVSGPTSHAIGVFVNAGMQEVVRLPIPVTDRGGSSTPPSPRATSSAPCTAHRAMWCCC